MKLNLLKPMSFIFYTQQHGLEGMGYALRSYFNQYLQSIKNFSRSLNRKPQSSIRNLQTFRRKLQSMFRKPQTFFRKPQTMSRKLQSLLRKLQSMFRKLESLTRKRSFVIYQMKIRDFDSIPATLYLIRNQLNQIPWNVL